MKIGIMQPYFMPYIGYWQLINAVDEYVIYDDVNFIKGGWINRNRILVNGKPKYYNIILNGASPNKLINQVEVNNDSRIIDKSLRIIEGAYKKAPYYQLIYPLMVRILKCGKKDIASYIEESFKIICEYLDIKTKFLLSSSLNKDCNLRGQEKVLEICKILGATEYYNAIGGQKLYSSADFKECGIDLSFLKSEKIEYRQFGDEFQSNLSIIDVLMFNSKEQVKELLEKYTLITGGVK